MTLRDDGDGTPGPWAEGPPGARVRRFPDDLRASRRVGRDAAGDDPDSCELPVTGQGVDREALVPQEASAQPAAER